MTSDTEKLGRKLVLPTEALIHTVQPTTTTSTKPVAVDPACHSRKRSNSREALSALTSPTMPPRPSPKLDDHGALSQAQKSELNVAKADSPSYEAFPSFDSWTPRPRFSLTRSFSLRSPLGWQSTQDGQGRPRVLRSWTNAGPIPTTREAHPLENEEERTAWVGERLSRTQICLWVGPWRRTSSGEFICPCGEHRLAADSPRINSLEDKMRGILQGGVPRM